MTKLKLPNILITGTPGTGKTTTAQLVSQLIPDLNHLDISNLVKEKSLHDGYNSDFDTYILNEDKVCDEIESLMEVGGNIVDFHSCDFFPQDWFDLIVVLRTDNSILYPRLEKRLYSQKKITENITCEIMQVVLEEAFEFYPSEIIVELQSNSVDEMESNIDRIHLWYQDWISRNNNDNDNNN